MVRRFFVLINLAILVLSVRVYEAAAAVAGGVLPWDPPIATVQNDLTGTVAHGFTAAALVIGGLGYAHSDHGQGIRKLSATGLGGAVGLGAIQAMNGLFGAGALI